MFNSLIEIILLSLEINFPNELDSFGMNAGLSNPVKFHALSFSNISATLSNLEFIFLGSLETEMHHLSQQDQMMVKGRKSGWIHIKRENTSYFLGDCFHFGLQRFDWITS